MSCNFFRIIASRFWATVCKTVRHTLSDRCLSCPVCLSVTLLHRGQTVRWINMKLCMKLGLGPQQKCTVDLISGTLILLRYLRHPRRTGHNGSTEE